ncbi:MAG TPA: class I SAM-dependent methyltransferase [Anaerolineales bacterium]|jgi:SAM-dependent methyltransferase
MAEHMNLYQKASHYDIIFDRDVGPEIKFLENLYQQHGPGRPLESVLDIACGPGYHARAFARQGVRAAGIDLGEAMIQLAGEKAVDEGLSVEWLVGDMRQFTLSQPVDLAFSMFDAIDPLLTNEDVIRHLRAIRTNLTESGVYVIDLTHPRDCSPWHYGDFQYQGTRNGVDVILTWATNNPTFDWSTGVGEVEVKMQVRQDGRETVITDRAMERFLDPQHIQLLVALAGQFEIAGWYGNHRIDQPFDNSDRSQRMIAVVRRNNH